MVACLRMFFFLVFLCSFATLLFWLVQGRKIISKLFPRDPITSWNLNTLRLEVSGQPNHPLTFGDWIPRAHPPLQVPVVGGYSGSMSGPSVVPLFSQERPAGCLGKAPLKTNMESKN